jgi:acyl transferase domain-containing protein/NADPH:quinone reductase-like Zn-dependent oxidoreductase/phospholipid N-methyltransferase
VASFGFGGSNAHAILDDAYHYLLSTGQKGIHNTLSTHDSIANARLVDDGTYNAPFPVAFETCGNGLKDTGYLNGDPSGTTPAVEGMKIGTQTTDNDLPYTSEKVYPRLLVLSAGDEDGINRLADAYQTYFANNAMLTTDLSYLDRLASTLSLRRSFLPWKSFALVKSFQELRQLSDSLSRPSLVTKKGEICFVFTGQGAQYENMGAELMVYRSFRASIDTFDRSLADLGCKWMISDMLQRQGMSGIMDDPEYSQPMTTAIQIALYDLLSSFNMKPAVVLGHSSGEIAAAYAAGGLSLQSACLVAYYRGKYASSIMRSRSNPGAMMAVNLSEDSMRDVLSRLAIAQNTLCVACINSPENVTISGDEIAIDLVRAHLQLENVRARKLNTGVAYHSPQMKQYADDYASKLDFLIPGVAMPQRPRLISTITGLYLERLEDVCKPEYWTTNLVSPVLFHKAIQTMSLAGSKTIPRKLGAPRLYKIQDVVEIGPHQTLRRPIQECLGHDRLKSQITYHATLVRQSPPIQTVLCLVGELFSVGHPVDVCKANEKDQVDASILQPLLDLPSYPFNHSKRYWYETPLSKQGRLRRFGKLELLGTPVSDWNAFQPRWRKFFDVGETPWIGHHRVNGKIIYPATGMVVMAMEAANQMADSERPITGYELRDAVFSSPIVIDEAGKKEVQLHMQPVRHLSSNDTQAYKFFIYSRTNRGDWFENSQGVLQVLYGKENSSRDQENQQREKEFYGQRYNEALDACRHQVDVEDMYKCFESNGLAYGPSFRALKDLSWDGDRTAIGVVQCFQWTTEQSHNNRQKHVSHPVTLDAAGQLMWVALTRGGRETLFNGAAVTRIKYAWVSSVGAAFPENTHLRAACITSRKGDRGTDCSMFALDSNGNLKLQISHMETTAVGGNEENRTLLGSRQICFKMDYIPDIDLMGPEQLYTFTKLDIQSEEDSIAFYRDLELALLYFASLASEKGLDGLVRSNPKPYMGKYVTWLKLQLQRHKDGQLLHSDPSWETHLHDTEFMKQLICRLEGTNAEGKFFMSVGRNLQAIIRGSADPLELMFQSGLAEKHYQEVCDKIQCSKRLSIYLDALSRKHPHMSVLEVGAGTGSITAHVLHSLVDISAGGSATSARIGQYDYTDISESFFEQARNRFAAFSPTVKYQLLNIETDIGSQGYKPESYDLVVAAWVLHATRDLSATIRNVRRLLRPGGKLVLLEITEPEILRNGFAFGTLPGWWLSSEAERQLSPCVSATQWTALLVENGFEKVDIVLPDYETMTCKENSILIATNMKQVITTQPRPDQEEAIILVNPESCLQNIVGEQLRSMLSASGTYSSCRMEAIGNKSLASVRHASTLLFLVELDRPYISALTEASFETLKSILARAKGLLWVTCSDSTAKFAPELQMVRGLTRVLSTEKPGRTCVTLGFESVGVEPSFYAEQTFQVFSTNLISPTIDKELEYTERNGTLFIHRVSKSEELNYDVHYKTHATIENRPIGHSPPLVMNLSVSGLLDSICFSEDMKYYTDLTADQVEIKVEAIGINFRDVLVALGRYEGIMGMECAGTVTRVGTNCTEFRPGDRVCAAIVGCSKTHVRCPHRMPVKIPDTISTIEAASLPVTGVTAYHSLVTLARLQREESILIHSAAGGTGQMLLQIAQMVGAKVYVTVGTEEKKNLIKTVYGLSDTNIFYSRDASFAKDVYRATNGKGVDVVVNTLAGELLLASWECIAPFGRFVELGKTDIEANFKLPMSNFRKNVTFYAVAVDSLLLERPAVVNQALRAVLNLILSDKLKPASPLVVNSIANVEPALRAIQSGQNIGKTVLTLASSDIVSVSQLTLSTPLYETYGSYFFDRQSCALNTLPKWILWLPT